ncbi:MAG TPA: tryptophan synthase subunit alpha [Opitutales bacterium]|jgi:tryptophan synthase alpha chain|nr:tryptophan synthase subunit alpha [Opitutales bacterium]
MSRIAAAFARARAQKRAAFVAYLCAGDPDAATSHAACRALLKGGVDILELGLPFTDPLADGLANQLAAQRALEAGTNPAGVLQLVRELRAEFPEAPIVFYAYYNMIYVPGVDNFCWQAAQAGLDGILALDCPPEEAGELLAASRKHQLDNIFIVAPTTPPGRIARIAQEASGFIYYVSLEGVTGERAELPASIPAAVWEIRRHTKLPVVVGFGVSTAAHVRQISTVADGVVVGSALVNTIAANLKSRKKIPAALGAKFAELRTGLAAK